MHVEIGGCDRTQRDVRTPTPTPPKPKPPWQGVTKPLLPTDSPSIVNPQPKQFVPFETRYPPEWIHDPTGPNPRMEFADVPIHETWAGTIWVNFTCVCVLLYFWSHLCVSWAARRWGEARTTQSQSHHPHTPKHPP